MTNEVIYDLMASKPGVRVHYRHDLQSRVDANLARIPGRFNPPPGPRGSVAILGYGPSLQTTWMDALKCDTIWTTSGAHDFLLAKNVVPHYHTDVEWRPHKKDFIKTLHPEVHYVIAATVDPNYFERVTTEQVSIFYVGQPEMNCIQPEDALTVPPDWDVVMAVIRAAALMGYNPIHLFGVDYCFGPNDQVAAGEHHGIPKDRVTMGCRGYQFRSSTDMVEGCYMMPHVMGAYPQIEYQIHGNGMLIHYIQARLEEANVNQRELSRIEQTLACIE